MYERVTVVNLVCAFTLLCTTYHVEIAACQSYGTISLGLNPLICSMPALVFKCMNVLKFSGMSNQ